MPIACSAAAPWPFGGSSHTVASPKAIRSGSTQSACTAARSDSSSQVAEAIAAATGPR